ncbi:MAG: serpin family protein [Candidatus Zixiibacteriota bacterium]
MVRYAILLIGVCTLFACQENATDAESHRGSPKPVTQIDNRLVDADNRFGFELLSELTRPDATENVFISSASVALALTMTYNGASGETQTAMADALELSGMPRDEINAANADLLSLLADPDPDVRLAVANSLWARKGIDFDAGFLARNQEFFAAEIRALDFTNPSAADTINAWVSEKTRERIPEIVSPPISRATVLFLINAIHFKGMWTYQFDESQTRDGVFHLADGRSKSARFMMQSGDFRYLVDPSFRAICLPYGSGRWGMYIFLPNRESTLADFLARLDYDQWQKWMTGFRSGEARILIPRFRLEYEASLVEPLQALGMGVAFSGEADFSAMTPSPHLPLMISNVKHKTFLEVNEEGTEAAAATSVEISLTSLGPFVMNVDHPFFCAIRDDSTGVVLFMGAVNEPM